MRGGNVAEPVLLCTTRGTSPGARFLPRSSFIFSWECRPSGGGLAAQREEGPGCRPPSLIQTNSSQQQTAPLTNTAAKGRPPALQPASHQHRPAR